MFKPHDALKASVANSPVKLLLACLLTVSIAFLPSCERFALDRQMEELCRKDGGVKVYEKIRLPRSMFDQWGDPFPGWRNRPPPQRLGNEYLYSVEVVYLKRGDPMKGEGRLERQLEQIVRRSDGKLLGEAVSYGRAGGDFIAYAHPSSLHCPIQKSDSDGLIKSVFGRE